MNIEEIQEKLLLYEGIYERNNILLHWKPASSILPFCTIDLIYFFLFCIKDLTNNRVSIGSLPRILFLTPRHAVNARYIFFRLYDYRTRSSKYSWFRGPRFCNWDCKWTSWVDVICRFGSCLPSCSSRTCDLLRSRNPSIVGTSKKIY